MDTDKRSQRPLQVLFLFLCNTCDISSFANQITKQMCIGAPVFISVHRYQFLQSSFLKERETATKCET